FHVRLVCPSDSAECKPQPARPADDGCGQELAYWFTDAVLHPRPGPPAQPKPGPKMADLPPACRQVLLAPELGRRSPAGSSPIRQGHVEVAVFVAKNNPKARGLEPVAVSYSHRLYQV